MQAVRQRLVSISTVIQFFRSKPLVEWAAFAVALGLSLILAFLVSQDEVFYAAVLVISIPLFVLFIARPFYGVIFWLLLMPFVSAFSNASTLYWLVHRMMIPATLIMAVISRTFRVRECPQIKIKPPEVFLIALFFVLPIIIFLSQNDPLDVVISLADQMLLPICMYFVMRVFSPQEREIKVLRGTVIFIAISQSVIGLLSWFLPDILPSEWTELQGLRTTGSLADPYVFTTYLMFSIMILFHDAMYRKLGFLRSLLLGICGLSALCIFLSLQRGAWLAGLLVATGLLIKFPKIMWRIVFYGLLIIGVGGGIFSEQLAAAARRMSEEQPIHDRVVVNDAMLQMVEQKPILGWGYGRSNDYLQSYYRTVGDATVGNKFITSHNTFLTVITELGIIGFIFYIFPFIWWAAYIIFLLPKIPEQESWKKSLLMVLCFSLAYHTILCNFEDMRYSIHGTTLWWMTLGLIASLASSLGKDLIPTIDQRIFLNKRGEMTNVEWVMIRSLLPEEKPKVDRPQHDHRQVLNGILWWLRTEMPWRDMPEKYGKWTMVYGHFRRWREREDMRSVLGQLLSLAGRTSPPGRKKHHRRRR